MTINLSYTRRGSGEPLVLMHGIGHRLEAFDPVVEQLAENFDVIAVDLPGFGKSPGFDKVAQYSIEALAEVVADNFSVWGIDKPHVVGNSMGGAVAITLAQQGKARSATGLSPAGYFFPWSLLIAGLPLLLLKLGAYAPKPLLKFVSRTKIGRLAMGFSLYKFPLRHSPEDSYEDALAMRESQGFWPMFLKIIPSALRVPALQRGPARVPITIAWGENDILLTPSQAGIAARHLSGVDFVLVEHAGHVPMADNPDKIIATIKETAARAQAREEHQGTAA